MLGGIKVLHNRTFHFPCRWREDFGIEFLRLHVDFHLKISNRRVASLPLQWIHFILGIHCALLTIKIQPRHPNRTWFFIHRVQKKQRRFIPADVK